MAQQVRQCSAFELALHEVCSRIPSGKVSTYGAVAKVLRSSPRAVGQVSCLMACRIGSCAEMRAHTQ